MVILRSGEPAQYLHFVAVDSTDLKTRETGLSSFTVYRARGGGAAAAMTTPTVAEVSSANMPGLYTLLLDEDTTLATGKQYETITYHITQASMAPVTISCRLVNDGVAAPAVPYVFKADAIDKTVYVMAYDRGTKQPKTGLVYNTSGLSASYARSRGARVAITLATQTVTGAHSDGGFVEIDDTNQPGLYRLDLPDAVLVTGVNDAWVTLKGTDV